MNPWCSQYCQQNGKVWVCYNSELQGYVRTNVKKFNLHKSYRNGKIELNIRKLI